MSHFHFDLESSLFFTPFHSLKQIIIYNDFFFLSAYFIYQYKRFFVLKYYHYVI